MSTEPEVPPFHVRMTGLNVDQLSAIGFITVSWNALERMIEFCIWAAADWDDDVGGNTAVQFAVLEGKPKLSISDFEII